MADGSVLISTKMDLAGIKKGQAQIARFMNDIAKNANKIDDLKVKMSELASVNVPTKEYAQLTQEFEKASIKLEELDQKQAKFVAAGVSESSAKWKTLQHDLDNANSNYMRLLNVKKQFEASGKAYTAGVNTVEYQNLANQLNNAEMEARELNAELLRMKFSQGAKYLKLGLKQAVNVAAKLVSVLKNAAVSFGKMIFGAKNFSKSMNSVTGSFRRLIPAMLATEGMIGILRKAVNAYMQQNQQLAATLQGAWLNMGNALSPIIDRMVNLIATAVAYLVKFLNLLGFVGKSTSNQISNAGAAAKKETDKLKKQLLSFDELNVLQSDKDSDTGGGAGTPSAVTPEVTLPDWAKLMAEQLKSGQWAEAAITLTDSLNQMVASVDWVGVGQRFGEKFNGVLTFLATFIQSFDWFSLGTNLAVGLNNLIDNVDWSNLGVLLGAKFKILIEGLGGFFTAFDWNALGLALADAITGLFNSIDWEQAGETFMTGLMGLLDAFTVFIQETDWQQIGNQIALFISSIDWAGVTQAIAYGIGEALIGFAELLWGMFRKPIMELKALFEEAMNEMGGSIIGGLLLGIVYSLVKIGEWIVENIFKPFIDAFCDAFGIHSPSTVMAEQGGYIIEGLFNGITQTWQNVQAWLNALPEKFKTALASVLSWIRTTFISGWNAAWNSLKDGVIGAVNGVISAINGMLSLVAAGVNSLFDLLSFNINIPGLGSIGLSLPHVSAPQIPYLAKGAVIPPNAPFAAVLGDQRHGNNIEAPEDLIRKIVREETADGAGNEEIAELLRELIAAVSGIRVGDEVIGRAAQRYNRSASRAGGW